MKIRNFDFFNLFYSFGAAIVLLGALFKVLDTTYADYIFITGLVVEILVFLVSAFLFSKKQKELSWEKIFPELVNADEQDDVQEVSSVDQSVVSLGSNMHELSQNLGDIAHSFKQMKSSINNLDSSVTQLESANAGYKEEMEALKKNLTDINNYYSDFISALNSKTKRD